MYVSMYFGNFKYLSVSLNKLLSMCQIWINVTTSEELSSQSILNGSYAFFHLGRLGFWKLSHQLSMSGGTSTFLILHGKWGIEVPPYICFPKLYLLLFSNKKTVYIIFIFITVHDYCIKKLLKHLWNSSKIINNWLEKQEKYWDC